MNYNQKELELKWQRKWQELGIYKFDPASTKPVYSIDVPPRYASGALHVGHAMHYVHIDFVARFNRMLGYNVLMPLCFDVNGMPIEVNVEKKHNIVMRETEKNKFVKLCKEFARENIEIMKAQFIALGTSFDPSVYYQTDEEYYRRLTQISFIKLYEKGLVYKGSFPINYCCKCRTALAHAEIEYTTRTTKLNYIKFRIKDSHEYVVIATTRPELLPACQLVGINPKDESKRYLLDKKLIVPLFEKKVSVKADDAVDPNFGTGIVMICTIGDKDDLKWVRNYSLPLEIIIDEKGKLKVSKYKGLSIQEARNAILEDLKSQGLLVTQEDLEQNVGTCWRCHMPTEIIVKAQFFLKTLEFKDKVSDFANEMEWYPDFMKQRLKDWVSALAWDWVISRQRYFATPIPVWECKNCKNIILAREEDCYIDPLIDKPPVEKCPSCGSKELVGCQDVFDTWMDSSITPLYNSFWQRDSKLFSKIYPMELRPQAHEIIRTWLFYTILRSLLLTDKQPFKAAMIDGFMMGPDGRPMHTSWGNVVDPMEMINKYSADAFRYFSALCALGQDSVFREKDLVHGIRFCRKFWNIQKFINQITKGETIKELESIATELKVIDKWILSKYSELVGKITNYLKEFKFDQVVKELEYFAWHEFADHYIELVKYRGYKKAPEAIFTIYTIGLGLTKLLAPFLPHLTEEVYELNYKSTKKKVSVHLETFPEPVLRDDDAYEKGEFVKGIVSAIRSWKIAHKIPLNKEVGVVEIAAQKPMVVEECKEDLVNTIKAKELLVKEKLSRAGELLVIEDAKILISKHL